MSSCMKYREIGNKDSFIAEEWIEKLKKLDDFIKFSHAAKRLSR